MAKSTDVVGGLVVLGSAVIGAAILFQIGKGKNYPAISKELNLTLTDVTKTLFKD